MLILISSFIQFLQLYMILLVIRILLSWFQVDWSNPIFSTLSQLTDPYLNLFRSIIPSLGGFDFSPILAFLLIRFMITLLSSAL